MTKIIESKYTVRSRRYLITSARHTCVAVILILLFASAAWGQDQADLRISTLTSELKQGDSFVRWRAARALLKIGSYSKAAVPALIEALKIEEADISDRAREALVKIGSDAVPDLIKALTDRDSIASSKAIDILAAIGVPATPALIEALKDHDEDVRLGAFEALGGINLRDLNPRPTTLLPILFEALRDPNPAIRRAAVQNISCAGAESTPGYLALIEALNDQDQSVRSAAASAICCVRLAPAHPSIQAALTLLLDRLKNRDANVRSGAAQALASLGSTAKPALVALLEAAKDTDEKVRSNVARALGAIEPNADPVVLAALLAALRDSDKHVRSAATSALKSAPAKAVVYPLIIASQDSEPSVRRSAADSLARRDAGFAVPRLIQLMSDRDAEVRNAAGRALEAIGHDAGKALVKASRDKDLDIRNRAALILEKVDKKDALAAYIEALKDGDAAVRSSAASSLGRFAQGPDEKVVALELIQALKESDPSVRSSAARSLGSFAYNATVIPGLIEALKDPDNKVRYTAAQSVIRVHSEPKPVIPILISALKDQDPQVRSDAVIAIGSLSWEAKAAVPALIELLRDPNADVLRNAIDALGKTDTAEAAKVIVPHLVRLLSRRDKGIREAALGTLTAIGEPAAPSLARLLMGPDSSLRVKTYYALVAQGNVFALVATLKSRDQDLRSLVVEALNEIREGSTNNVQGPDPLVDPSRKYVFYRGMTACGFENEGRTMFVGELDSGRSFPILASCAYLGAPTFLEYGGKYYLLVAEGDGGTSFWLYDMKANEFVIHAEGEINETKERGVFSYAYADDEHDTAIPAGKVSFENLIKRERPLRLLPRYPLHGLTLRNNTKVVHTFSECFQDDTSPPAITIIRNAGTKVFLISKCDDGSFEIYYVGVRGNVRKGSLKPTK